MARLSSFSIEETMDRLKFWFVVGAVAAVWIFLFKGIAAQTNIPSVQKFAQGI